MRDAFISLFDPNSKQFPIMRTIAIVVGIYIGFSFIFRSLRNFHEKREDGYFSSEARFYRSCKNFCFLSETTAKKFKYHLLPLIIVTGTVVMYVISIRYEKMNISDSTSNLLFILAFIIDVIVLFYYVAIFVRDAERNDTIADSVFEVKPLEKLDSYYITETTTNFEKWDYETAWRQVGEPHTETYDASEGANLVRGILNLFLVIVQFALLFGSAFIYAISRMISTAITFVTFILFFWIRKPYYYFKARIFYLRYLKRQVARYDRIVNIFSFPQFCNEVIDIILNNLIYKSFCAVVEGRFCSLFVAPINNKCMIVQKNVSFVCDTDCSKTMNGVFKFDNEFNKLCTEPITVNRGPGAVYSYKRGLIYVSYNPDGDHSQPKDFSAILISTKYPVDFVLDGAREIVERIQYKWIKEMRRVKKEKTRIILWEFPGKPNSAKGNYPVELVSCRLSDIKVDNKNKTYRYADY